MKSIKELVMKENKPVYIHTPSKATAIDFLKQAEKEGFLFADGKKPSKRLGMTFLLFAKTLQ